MYPLSTNAYTQFGLEGFSIIFYGRVWYGKRINSEGLFGDWLHRNTTGHGWLTEVCQFYSVIDNQKKHAQKYNSSVALQGVHIMPT